MNKNLYIYFFALLLFGSNGIWASYIELKSYETIFFRTFLGVIFLAFIYLISRNKNRFWKYKKEMILTSVSGIAMGLNWLLLFESYKYVGVSIATLCCYCGPILVIIVSAGIFKTQITKNNIIGILIVMSGLMMISFTGNISGNPLGIVLGLASAIMYAMMILTSRHIKFLNGTELAMVQLFASFILLSMIVFVKDGISISILREDVLPILALGVINTGMACYLFMFAIRKLKVQTISTCGYLEPLAAVIFSAIFLQEVLKGIQIMGGILIISGALIGEHNENVIYNKKK